MRERAFRAELAARVLDAGPAPAVVDVGAGTGTLAIALAAAGARVTAVEPDPAALARARGKEGSENVTWVSAHAGELPAEDRSIDRVVLSLVLHHLPDADQVAALAEARRVLRPAGRLLVAEWTEPGDPLMALAFRGLRLIDGREAAALAGRGGVGALLRNAGFAEIVEHLRLRTAFGRLAITSARPG